ncbi:alpha-ketoglutarate-dependent dioxygenase alkB homolog 7, mitochondrial isoform X1 [Pieris rapae]|uniref:alpha-ketoglutarate-dependent dioxygenase alkB homolog 7, mitochondrial isoform X1 n=2 Tax=Pieris rapae TaxID=64459 RepID=UPI000B9271A6|nr:alpha-ketoglutarate-dependent dioxygenase alkB homolog 7, mitochondrial isoform X1 [Pieris rapae]
MRILTLNLLRNSNFDLNKLRFLCSTEKVIQPKGDIQKISGDLRMIEFLPSWKADEDTDLRKQVVRDMRVIPDFINETEEISLLSEVEPQLKRMRYEFDHWDNAIEGYRETERQAWNEQNSVTLARVRSVAFENGAELLPHTHVLDLAPAGYIKPHVDAVRFCGDTIAGLCLLSGAVMRLMHENSPDYVLDVLLPRRSLYIMSGVARYQFNHAVLSNEKSVWRGGKLIKKRRVAIITREQPKKPADII